MSAAENLVARGAARLLNKAAVAQTLSVSRRTVDRLIAAGDIRTVSIGSRVLVKPAELDRYIESLEEAS